MSIKTGQDAMSNYEKRDLTDREVNWIWKNLNLSMQHPNTYINSTTEKKKIIIEIFNRKPSGDEIFRNFLHNKETYLLDLKDLKLVNKNEQLLIFAINLFTKNYQVLFDNHLSLSNFDYFIYLVDNIRITKESKVKCINDTINLWSNLQYNKCHTNWIDENNEHQINWSWDYLKKNFKLAATPTLPINSKQRYNYIISSIDLMGFSSSNEAKELFLIKMKKTWSQKKYRESGKIKKPHHMPLTKERHDQLKKLSVYFNKSIPDILDFIVEKTYKDINEQSDGKLDKYEL